MLTILNRYRHFALLFLRLGGGSFMAYRGYKKLLRGTDLWEKLGSAMSNIGIDFLPVFWGFMASLTEFLGGILICLGLFHRISAAFLAFVMLIATIAHLADGDSLMDSAHAIELFTIYLALMILGPGKLSFDRT